MQFLEQLVQLQLVSIVDGNRFLEREAEHLAVYATPEMLGNALVQAGLITAYQLDRVAAGTTHGLILGNRRVLDRLGAGAMGVVFRVEHILLKRLAAAKVLPVDDDCPPLMLDRFYSEVRVLADLHHPNIVQAFDAGYVPAAGPGMPELLYLVMELLPGGDLEQYVLDHGPVSITQGCEWIRQVACGLQDAHDHHIIHRDIKPSNLMLSEDGQAKLGDFGLIRQFSSRLTNPGRLLGTLDYMAPEQSLDPTAISCSADIYALGACLFWLLTGQTPYPPTRSVAQALRLLQNGRPRQLRELRPEAPPELEDLIDRMLDRDPARRPDMPIKVMNSLLRLTSTEPEGLVGRTARRKPAGIARQRGKSDERAVPAGGPLAPTGHQSGPKRVLIVDDDSSVRTLARSILEPIGCICEEAEDGARTLASSQRQSFDLFLLDINLPDTAGYELCHHLRQHSTETNSKFLIVSGMGDHDQLAEALSRGADDYIPKPFGVQQLKARVQHLLHLKEVQDQSDFLAAQLVLANQQYENSLAARNQDVRRAQDALLFTMAKMAESRDGETSGHLRRLQRYTACLAKQMAGELTWEGVITDSLLDHLERCVPLHDIGKLGLPDYVLLKPGKLTTEERALMETHTLIGDRILRCLGEEYGESMEFLGTASAIVRHHHERFDGSGYPDHLAGDAIPAAARLVALADVYDALRRSRLHKQALTHADTARILREESPGQFDPAVFRAFAACEGEFERIFRDIPT
jgi:response regulator RpfG family c-di-GMP phosphodiesterase